MSVLFGRNWFGMGSSACVHSVRSARKTQFRRVDIVLIVFLLLSMALLALRPFCLWGNMGGRCLAVASGQGRLGLMAVSAHLTSLEFHAYNNDPHGYAGSARAQGPRFNAFFQLTRPYAYALSAWGGIRFVQWQILGARLRVLQVPTVYPLVIMAVVVLLLARRGCRAPRPGCCRVCGYDLRATPERCPECGWRREASNTV